MDGNEVVKERKYWVGYSKESNRYFRGGRSRSQPPCHLSKMFSKLFLFYIPVRAEDAVKLTSKEIDKNERENQTKTRWVWSGDTMEIAWDVGTVNGEKKSCDEVENFQGCC